tara:strand:- start:5523 stop:8210 length:2688 start_codon:yes stop_codon:yes gene_type:complete
MDFLEVKMALTVKAYVFLIFFFFFSTGCSQKKTPEQLFLAAQDHIQAKHPNSAIIELKKLRRAHPKHVKAMVLLGKVYLSKGNVISAEKEFSRAEAIGANPNEFYDDYARAFFLQSKFEDILYLKSDMLEVETVKAALFYYKGLATHQIGDIDEAKDFFIKSKTLNNTYVFGQLSEAYGYILLNQMKEALSSVNSAIATSPNNLDAISLKARLLFNMKLYPEALSLFELYADRQPEDLRALLILASAYVKNSKFKQAEAISDKLLKKFPYNGLLNQIKGVSRYQDNDYAGASRYLSKAIQNNYSSPETELLAGFSEYRLGNYEQSYKHLIRVEEVLPSGHVANKLLAVIRLQLGYNKDAIETFSSLEELDEEDSMMLNSATYELLKDGDFDGAKQVLVMSTSLGNNTVDNLIRQGILRLSLQDIDGITDLEKATDLYPDNKVGKAALANAYIANKKYTKALELAKEWQSENDNAGFNLEGLVYSKLNDPEKAEKAFTKALLNDETNIPSLMFFVSTSLKDKKTEIALKHLKTLLTARPYYFPGLRLNYIAHQQNGNTKPALDLMQGYVKENALDLKTRLLFAQMLVAENKPLQVVELLKALDIDDKDIKLSYYWLALGDSYSKIGKDNNALNVFSRWTKVMPQQRAAWLRIISILERKHDYAGALRTVQQALEVAKNDKAFRLVEINFLIKNGNVNQAQKQLNKFFSSDADMNNPVIRGFMGKILLVNKQYKEARIELLSYYDKNPNRHLVGDIFDSYIKEKLFTEADSFLERHIVNHPQDVFTMLLLANQKINSSHNDAAKLYESILLVETSNLMALNNLAWLKSQMDYMEAAIEISQKGLLLYPNSSMLLDTAATINDKVGNTEEAKKLISQALELSPDNASIKMNYIRIHKP